MTTTTTPPPAPVQENLLKLNKAELQAEYKKVIGSEPDPALTKDELANEIKAALEKVVPTNPNIPELNIPPLDADDDFFAVIILY